MASQTLKDFFGDELVTLLSVESQVVKALPSIMTNVSTKELAGAIKDHTAKTVRYVTTLKAVTKLMKRKQGADPEPAARAILQSCATISARFKKGNLRDAALLAVLQRLEHYRAALYSSTFALAKQLGEKEVLNMLHEGAAQDDLTAKRFAQIAVQVNAEAFIDMHSERCVSTITHPPT
jgi:ferritin-like metal-binding protein YciE